MDAQGLQEHPVLHNKNKKSCQQEILLLAPEPFPNWLTKDDSHFTGTISGVFRFNIPSWCEGRILNSFGLSNRILNNEKIKFFNQLILLLFLRFLVTIPKNSNFY